MKVNLDHAQRLNLHALLGAQCVDVGAIRGIWALQDRLALTTEEEKAIELRREFINGQERVLWNPALNLQPTEFDLSEVEVSRIKAALQSWASYAVGTDRRWLQPLLSVIFETGISC